MQLTFDSDVEEFRTEFSAFLDEHLPPETETLERPTSVSHMPQWARDWQRLLFDNGWLLPAQPPEFGGRNATVLQQFVHLDELCRRRIYHSLNPQGVNIIAASLISFGSDEQKHRWAVPVLKAEMTASLGMSEPSAGSDLASLRTRAVRDGDDFVVNGQKIWTSLGHRADWCQLYVRTDPEAPKHKGISCLIVDMKLPGIEARPLVTLNGAADFAEVFFNDVRVPADSLLGPLNGGWRVATTTLSHERAGAARLYAQMQVQVEDLVADLADHMVDGRPALENTATLRRLGEIAVRISYLELLCKRSISATLHGGDALGSASLAKSVWAEVGQDLAVLAFDLLGSRSTGGRWTDHRLSSRSLTIAGGTTQINKGVTAVRVLGLPRG